MADNEAPKLRLERPAIFICDIQEGFRKAIFEFDKVISTATKLLRAAPYFHIPVYVTTQNRARLGDTVAELKPYLAPSDALTVVDADKTRFSMWIPDVASHFPPSAGPASVAIVGIESHICVTQTALDLLRAGHRVFILADGVSSCNREEVPIALARLRAEGAVVTTSESFLYEMMGDAAIPQFRSMVKLVKETSADTRMALSGLLSKM